jgi:hypothetical protein
MKQVGENSMILILLSVLAMIHQPPLIQNASEKVVNSKYYNDVPKTHWAYRAVKDLKPVGVEMPVITCVYHRPPKNFKDLPITRYEFAIVLDRAMKGPLSVIIGKPNAPISQKSFTAIRRLLKEFHSELDEVGLTELKATQQLDALRKHIKKS